MKKIILLAAAFVAITFASCGFKKDRVCTCTEFDGTVAATTYYDAKKKDARLLCSQNNSQTIVTYPSGNTYNGGRTTCELK